MGIALFVLIFFVGSVRSASLFPVKPASVQGHVDGPRSWYADIATTHGRIAKDDPVVRPTLFEGDMVGIVEAGDSENDIDAKLSRLSKSGVIAQRSRWYGGWVFYEMSSTLSTTERSKVLTAFKEFEKTDGIRFHPRSGHADYVLIKKNEPGCWATVGKAGGVQNVNLGIGCWTHGTIVHELMHAIGFYHEQSRTDRDSYVELNLKNVDPANHHNFRKYDSSQVTPGGTPYDYDSITHYRKTAFALDTNGWTIRPKAPHQSRPIGLDLRLSTTDISEINAMYPLCGILYQEDGLKGAHLRLLKGIQDTNLTTWSDSFSSARVTKGCTMTIYSLVDFKGKGYSLKAPTTSSEIYSWWSFVGQPYDNAVRSVKCLCT
ncbi:putative Zinc metalloproteinase nas-14 [Hypsibius exemplaris]|uniref:Metalloendopeptidase n=1 Tax=Hypsibius exemplaris TaxID=2072580 RepID=A0A9X6NIK4_HYPEX|nr:putative Zinc metalloproteinase nas-14 [Hypsibius exemplaris]